MSHLLPLSRVARLVGTTRGALQQMIKNGELDTFDGEIELDELLRVFPDVHWQDNGEYERVEEIKRKAFGKRIAERILPDKEVLAERLYELGREFASAKSLLIHYGQILRWLDQKIDDVADVTRTGGDGAQAAASLKQWLRQQVKEAPKDSEKVRALLAEESVMRVMSAQVTVQPSGHEFFVEGNDTILEAALRAGIPLNYGCSNGNCGDCKVRLVEGQVRKVHPHDFPLKEADKNNGAFLMCSFTAISDVVIEASIAGADDIPQQTITTRIKAIDRVDDGVLALHLTTPRSQRLRFLAGQHVHLNAGGIEGDYYVASCPCEDRHIELHVRRDNRPFARKAFDDLRKDDPVTLTGPDGHFVVKMDSRRPILFIAWDDGFGPIKSLIQHAISLDVAETMHLYWVAERLPHYQDNYCRSLADALDNFRYQPLTADADITSLARGILAAHPDLTRTDVYAAGPADFLTALREGALAQGLSILGWHSEVVI